SAERLETSHPRQVRGGPPAQCHAPRTVAARALARAWQVDAPPPTPTRRSLQPIAVEKTVAEVFGRSVKRNGPLPRASFVAVRRDYLWKIKIMKHVNEMAGACPCSGTFFVFLNIFMFLNKD
ncbi:hypothetical protein HW555_008485, partial [Spodoptera exigua]